MLFGVDLAGAFLVLVFGTILALIMVKMFQAYDKGRRGE